MSDATGVTQGSDTFDPGAARRRATPWSTGVRGLAGLAVLLLVLGHVDVPGVGDGSVGADLLVVILGFEIVVWATASRRGAVPRSRQRVVAPLLLVSLVSLALAWWWAEQSSTSWWQPLAHELTVAGQDAVGVPGMWTQSRTWPTSAAVGSLLALAATVGAALAVGWVIRRLASVGRTVSERSLVMLSCAVFAAVIVFAGAVVLDLLPSSYVAGPAVAVAQRAWELALGALVGGLVVTGQLPDRLHPALGTSALLLVAVSVGWPEALELPHGALVGIAGAVLLADAASPGPSRVVGALLRSAPLQVVGRFGYCWYLWHLTALLVVPLVVGTQVTRLQSLELLVLALWVAGLTYAVLGRRRTRGGALPIQDDPHVHGHASRHLPTALRSWAHAPRATAGVGMLSGPRPHFDPDATSSVPAGGRR